MSSVYRFTMYPEVGYESSKSTVGKEFQVHSNLPSRQRQFSWYVAFPLTESLSGEDKGVLDLCLPDSLMRKLSVFNFIQAKAFLFAIPVITTSCCCLQKNYWAHCFPCAGDKCCLGFLRLGWSISLN